MERYVADDLLSLDESIFDEKTCWKHHAYAPMGDATRYAQDISRGDTWAILPVYTIDEHLPHKKIRQGYFNREKFLVNVEVCELIERAGYTVQYLPPYSPDCSLIELTLSTLKARIKRILLCWSSCLALNRTTFRGRTSYCRHVFDGLRCCFSSNAPWAWFLRHIDDI